MSQDPIADIRQQLRDFAEARDWDQFHSPKNLSMAIAVEAAELVEIFQWLSEEQSLNLDLATRERVEMEVADVFIYLVRLADKLEIDAIHAAKEKIRINEDKYPEDRVRGDARKYSEYD